MSEIIIYEDPDITKPVQVTLEGETVWLTQEQMAKLFGRERSVITRHVGNLFREGELSREAVCAFFAHTAADGKTYQVEHYNLDVIISVGYRVKSQRGVRFRQWATSVLRQHLLQGYTLDQRRLAERGLDEARDHMSNDCSACRFRANSTPNQSIFNITSLSSTVYEGQHVQKGDQLGMFHFGGSTHCLIFRPVVNLEFDLHGQTPGLHSENIPVQAGIAVVTDSRGE